MTNYTRLILATRRDDLHVEVMRGATGCGFCISLGADHRPIVSTKETPYTTWEQAQTAAYELIQACEDSLRTEITDPNMSPIEHALTEARK